MGTLNLISPLLVTQVRITGFRQARGASGSTFTKMFALAYRELGVCHMFQVFQRKSVKTRGCHDAHEAQELCLHSMYDLYAYLPYLP